MRGHRLLLAGVFLSTLVLGTPGATAQATYVPGTKLVILRASTPLPERDAVERVLTTFAREHGFEAASPIGRSSVVYGKDPDLSLVGTFAPSYTNVVLWTDPGARTTHDKDISDLTTALRPLGFNQIPELPVDPD